MSVSIRPLHPVFVGEVAGVDCRHPLRPGEAAAIEAGMDRYAVLVFHDQQFTDDEQLAFTRHFGELEAYSTPGHLRRREEQRLGPGIADFSNHDKDGNIMAADHRVWFFKLADRLWHSDSSFRPVPAKYSLLSARVLPSWGGNTDFADMRAAYDALDAETRASIEGLRVYHSIVYSRHVLGFDFNADEQEKLKGAVHPLVRTIPRSGRRALYLASHAAHVVDWPVPEGRLLLRDLIDHATQPQFIYRHVWRPHDFVIWDNRCTMHRARPFDDKTHRRELRRTTTLDLPLLVSA
jgi:alpha-ketoglutarate-dependent 2,4-dichlorophenoxyacetate dioxygenase